MGEATNPFPIPQIDPRDFIFGSSLPQPSLEDITVGPHGPDRPISDVIARARGDRKPQGRWLSSEAGERAVSSLDTSKMRVGQAFSVPIAPGDGMVIRAYNDYPPSNLPTSEKYISDSAHKAVVILRRDGSIHTFPIGSEHPAYNRPAPMK
ncbi:hypothetical protein SPB21_11815 [Leptothoe sp. ISB3NOV94-8A]|uniref:hypothetical protein n=1 Tax=Adonisia turfae TaxID=2950184 RepID=UPI0013D11B47|nr:hypothetical protein [Adonisia turfae]